MITALTHFAADYSYSYNYTPATPQATAGIFGFLILFWIVGMAFAVVMFIAMWKMYEKAGRPGWAAIVPVYNSWVLAEIAGKPGWWGLYPLIAIVPIVGWIASIVISLMIALGVARNFGKSDAFGVFGLWLFYIVGYLILGFGSATYKGTMSSPSAPMQPAAPMSPTPPAPMQ